MLDKNSLLAQHHMLHQHKIDILDDSSKLKQRLFLEAWNSVQNANPIKYTLNIYKNLKNF